jgi:peptide/nickel transport system permease protein
MYLMGGITARDYPVINGSVILMAFIVCAMNLIVDTIYAFIDPRIKSQYESQRKKIKALEKITGTQTEVA